MYQITVIELARKAGVNLNTAYRWIWLGKISAGRDSHGRWMIGRAEAERFLKERSAKRARKNGQAAEHQKNWNFDDIFKIIRLLTIFAVSLVFVEHENNAINKWLEFMTLLISI